MACYGGGGLLGFAAAGLFPVRGRARGALVNAATIGQSATIALMLFLPAAAAQIAPFLAAGILGGFMNVHVMTLLQTGVPSELQGRVQSLATTLSVAVMPLGMAMAGIAFDLSGGNFLLVIGLPGLLMTAVSVLAAFSGEYRGFLEGVPEGASSAGGAGASRVHTAAGLAAARGASFDETRLAVIARPVPRADAAGSGS